MTNAPLIVGLVLAFLCFVIMFIVLGIFWWQARAAALAPLTGHASHGHKHGAHGEEETTEEEARGEEGVSELKDGPEFTGEEPASSDDDAAFLRQQVVAEITDDEGFSDVGSVTDGEDDGWIQM